MDSNQGGEHVSPNVLATYADTALSVDEFETQYARSVGGWEAAADDSLADYDDFLKRYVDFRLKVIDAMAAGIDHDSSLVAELEQYRSQLARPYLVEKEILDDMIEDLWRKRQSQVTVSHILLRVPGARTPEDTLAVYRKMVALRDSVLAGADFNDIAFRNSEDPSAKSNRGQLGTFTGGRMILPFEERAYSTEPGHMSDIFHTQYGYHLLFVHDRTPRSPDIRASHILIRAAGSDTADAWAKVQEVQAKLDEGTPFAQVAEEYSEDPGSAPNGGDLGFFGRGRMVPEFEKAAFSLKKPGDRSDWFRTRFGYHIVQLDEVKPLPTYEEAYDDLKSLAKRLPRYQAAEHRLGLEYREELGSTVDTLVIDSLTAQFPRDSVLYYFALEKWNDLARETEIATMGPASFTVGDLVQYGMQNRASSPPSTGRTQLYRYLDRMLDDKSLDVAASMLEQRDSTFAALMKEYRDGIVLFRIMEDSVWNRAAGDSLGIARHYEANKAKYSFPERMRVISFSASDDSLLSVVAESWTPGSTVDWSSQFENDAKFRIDTTFVADTTKSIYDRVLGKAPGDTYGPMAYRGGYILLMVDGLEAPRPKTLDEARADVLNEYQTEVEQEWLNRLHERYHARLFPENLTHVFQSVSASGNPPAGASSN